MKFGTGFNLKSFVAGVIVASLGITGVFAAGAIQSAEFNANKVVFNGKAIDMNSNPMLSVVKEGETSFNNYMPLRAVLEAMDYEVVWDGDTKTVHINTKLASAIPEPAATATPDKPAEITEPTATTEPAETAAPTETAAENETAYQSLAEKIVGYWTWSDESLMIRYHFAEDGHFEALGEVLISGGEIEEIFIFGTYTVEGNLIVLRYVDEENEEFTENVEVTEFAEDGQSWTSPDKDGDMIMVVDTGNTDWTKH